MNERRDQPPDYLGQFGFTFTWLAPMKWASRACWLSLLIVPLLAAAITALAELQLPPSHGAAPGWYEGAFLFFMNLFALLGLYGATMFTWIAWRGWTRPHWLSMTRALALLGLWALLTVLEGLALAVVAVGVWLMLRRPTLAPNNGQYAQLLGVSAAPPPPVVSLVLWRTHAG